MRMTDMTGPGYLLRDPQAFRGETTYGVNSGPYEVYLTPSMFKVVLQKSIPTQICQLILHIGNSKR